MKRFIVAGAAVVALIILGLSFFRVPDRREVSRWVPPEREADAASTAQPRKSSGKAERSAEKRPAWKEVAEALGIELEPPSAAPARPSLGVSETVWPGAATPVPAQPASPQATPAPRPDEPPPPMPQSGLPPSTATAPLEKPEQPEQQDDDSDRRPPSLSQIGFSPSRVSDGETSTLDLTIVDDLSGVQSVTGTVSSPSGRAILGFSAGRIGDSDLYETIITIPADAEQGIWFVSSVYMKDKAANATSVGYNRESAPPGARLSVESETSDSTPPVVQDIRLEKSSVSAGEKNRIFVTVVDDKTGVGTVSGVFESPGKAARIGFSCSEDRGSGTWNGEIFLPKNADCGEWKLQQLLVVDKANNRKGYPGSDPLLAQAVFYVGAAGECDSTAPVLDSILINPSTVASQEGGVIVISAVIRDDRSGVSGANGRVEGPPSAEAGGATPKIYFSLSHDQASPPDVWTAHLTVPRFSARGTWRVTSLQVIDKSNNFKIYGAADPALAGGVLQVQ